MVKAGLPGRAHPRKKGSSLSISSLQAASRKTSSPAQVDTGAKRASKRASLVDSTARSDSQKHAALSATRLSRLPAGPTGLPLHALSRSSLRRAKRKAREHLVGDVDLMKDLDEVVKDVEEGLEEEQKRKIEASKIGAKDPVLSGSGGGTTKAKGGAVSAKGRKNVLAQELARQSSIVTNAAFVSNPFQALRTHAQTSLALQPLPSSPALPTKGRRAEDVDMA